MDVSVLMGDVSMGSMNAMNTEDMMSDQTTALSRQSEQQTIAEASNELEQQTIAEASNELEQQTSIFSNDKNRQKQRENDLKNSSKGNKKVDERNKKCDKGNKKGDGKKGNAENLFEKDEDGVLGRQALELSGPPMKPEWGTKSMDQMSADDYLRQVQYERQFMCKPIVIAKKITKDDDYSEDERDEEKKVSSKASSSPPKTTSVDPKFSDGNDIQSEEEGGNDIESEEEKDDIEDGEIHSSLPLLPAPILPPKTVEIIKEFKRLRTYVEENRSEKRVTRSGNEMWRKTKGLIEDNNSRDKDKRNDNCNMDDGDIEMEDTNEEKSADTGALMVAFLDLLKDCCRDTVPKALARLVHHLDEEVIKKKGLSSEDNSNPENNSSERSCKPEQKCERQCLEQLESISGLVYGCLACLETPFFDDTMATLQRLRRVCKPHSKNEQMNLLHTIVVEYYGQRGFEDED